jgi:hypothetical protein
MLSHASFIAVKATIALILNQCQNAYDIEFLTE